MTQPGTTIQRGAPHSSEAERALLGSILLAPTETLEICSDKMTGSHFYVPAHALIYETLTKMFEKREVIDLVTVTHRLRNDGNLETVGGAPTVTSLFTFVPTAANAEYYVEIVRRKFIRREMIRVGTDLVRRAYEESTEENVILDDAQASVTSLALETLSKPTMRQVAEGVDETLHKFEVAYMHRGDESVTGLATGLIDFDRMTGGLKPQQLVIIAARPSQGKSALAMNIAEHIAIGSRDAKPVPVAVFSMEMSYQELCDRLTCSVTEVSLQRLRDGFFSEEVISKLPAKSMPLRNAALYIDDTPKLWITDFKARARRAATRLGIGCIVVDYLQLMVSPSRRAQENRVLEITEITGGLKAIAKELNIPVIVCAQLNREAEKRAYGYPKISDLRESGSIEQDADIVALLWRPIRHCATPDDIEACADKLKIFADDLKTYAVLNVAKQRNGPPGEIKLRFADDLTKFSSLTLKQWSNNPEERQK